MPQPLSHSVPKKFNSLCNLPKTISEVALNIGLDLSQADVNQLVHSILSGGQAGMAVAVFVAETLAGAKYQPTPQQVAALVSTLSHGPNQSLQISRVLSLKLRLIRIKKR
jgi:hypothetical protein